MRVKRNRKFKKRRKLSPEQLEKIEKARIKADRKKLLKLKIESIKLKKEQDKYAAMSPPDKFLFNLKKIYFSKLNSDALKMLKDFVYSVYEEARIELKSSLDYLNEQINKMLVRLEAQANFRLGDQFIKFKIKDITVQKLNELGSRGWKLAYSFDDYIVLCRDIIVKKKKNKN